MAKKSALEKTQDPTWKRSDSLLRSTALPGVSNEEIARRQARRLAAAKEDVVSEFDLLSGSQMELWGKEGRIFSVDRDGSSMFPAFQFDAEGQPLPVIARVLEILGQKEITGWGIALWFTANNGWLDGLRPVDLLQSEPEEVEQAAEREVEELFF